MCGQVVMGEDSKHCFSVEEECAVSWCNNRLEKENVLWKECLTKFVDALERFGRCLRPLMTSTVDSAEENVDLLIGGLKEFALSVSGKDTQ